MDVEGYEDRALRGAVKTLERFAPLVFVELWPPAMEQPRHHGARPSRRSSTTTDTGCSALANAAWYQLSDLPTGRSPHLRFLLVVKIEFRPSFREPGRLRRHDA